MTMCSASVLLAEPRAHRRVGGSGDRAGATARPAEAGASLVASFAVVVVVVVSDAVVSIYVAVVAAR
jgi:hypothetical protein